MNLLELDTVKYEVEILSIPVVEEETVKKEVHLIIKALTLIAIVFVAGKEGWDVILDYTN